MLIFFTLVGASVFVYNAKMFERVAPEVVIKSNGFWNMRSPLSISLKDLSGIVNYRVTLITKDEEFDLDSSTLLTPKNSINLELKVPKKIFRFKDKQVKIVVEASDASKWNFFAGNSVKKEIVLIIDKRRPNVSIVANSYKIRNGGSAIVVFKAEDENLKDLYIELSSGKRFKAKPFYKDGYFISLLAWDIREEHFKANVVATDEASNVSKAYIPLYLKVKRYKVSKIKLSNKFLDGKIAQLSEEFIESDGLEDPIERFKAINEDVRAKNEALIHEVTSAVDDKQISSFRINKFYPLKNGQVVANFGDHRLYYYNGEKVSESYHLGIDYASVKMGSIKASNSATVVFSNFNGIYGNLPILSHGLGLYTIYGHCSSVNVQEGDKVRAGQEIANTGTSGYAMGDHLHFGMLVQGIEVRPQEWMDKKWIKQNITDIIKDAKKIIDHKN